MAAKITTKVKQLLPGEAGGKSVIDTEKNEEIIQTIMELGGKSPEEKYLSVTRVLHQRGWNMRHLGMVFKHLYSEEIKAEGNQG